MPKQVPGGAGIHTPAAEAVTPLCREAGSRHYLRPTHHGVISAPGFRAQLPKADNPGSGSVGKFSPEGFWPDQCQGLGQWCF